MGVGLDVGLDVETIGLWLYVERGMVAELKGDICIGVRVLSEDIMSPDCRIFGPLKDWEGNPSNVSAVKTGLLLCSWSIISELEFIIEDCASIGCDLQASGINNPTTIIPKINEMLSIIQSYVSKLHWLSISMSLHLSKQQRRRKYAVKKIARNTVIPIRMATAICILLYVVFVFKLNIKFSDHVENR